MLQFILSGAYTWPISFEIIECVDGWRWESVDEKVCLAQGDKGFASEAEAQQDAIKWFEEYDAEQNSEPETKEDRLYFYQTPAY